MSNDYGDGVSRVLDPASTQILNIIWQEGACPLDSEWNLAGDLAAGLNRQQILSGIPSGWLGNDINPSKDYQTDPTWSNWFKFGRQRSGDKQSIMWANVNGWLIPVTGTKTGDPPGGPNNTDTWDKILLDPPPGSAGDARADFIFLEVWKARVSPYPSTLNKPNGSAIYRYGNVEGGQSYLPDDLIDPEIGEATTERIQLQYRIRVVKGLINLSTNPDGFDQSVVKAQGTQATPPSVGGYTFTNMREELGDPGLWRAGDGSANTLGTVDGYSYAIPIAIVFRRNSILWAGEPAQNLNGGFNRNPSAVDRTGTTTFSTIPILAADLSSSALSATLVSASNIPLPATPTSTVLIKIDEELITYSSISGTNTTLTGRGVNGTAAAIHYAGAPITVVSTRPDGLYSDQVTITDILDLRHAVNPAGFNYTNLLKSNLDKLLKGQLRSNWKRTGTDPRGIYLVYEDKISATPPVSLGITQLDAPDHIRLAFSDSAIQQPVEVIVAPVTLPATLPAVGTVTWGLTIQSTILTQAADQKWTVGDQISIPVSQFKNGVPLADTDQIRFLNDQPSSGTGTTYGTFQLIDSTSLRDFVNEGVEIGDTLVIFSGAAAGSYTITEVTTTVITVNTVIPAATSTYVIRKGSGAIQIRIDGQAPLAQHRFEVTPGNPLPTEDLTITLRGSGSPFPTTIGSSNLYITTQIQYGGGRGLSRRPDSIHNVTLLNPDSQLLHQTEYTQSGTFPLRTAWTSLWSKYREATYKSLLPVTAEAYADLGSKTVVVTPFQAIEFPIPKTIASSSIMPLGIADPLGVFDHLRYVALPRHLVPGWSAVSIPIIPVTSGGIFHRGINFMLMSHEGNPPNTSQFNPEYISYTISGASCAIFSTLDLQTSAEATYSTSMSYSGHGYTSAYAGIRKFNDDPSVVGALSTARGLGRHGLELPPYYGIARLFAVYEAQDYKTRGSNFNVASGGDRSLNGAGATNLLRDSFNGTTFWIELDANGDSTFILNADAIDISKSPNPITTFDDGDYVVESSIFGFGRGSFDISQPFKLAVITSAPTPLLLTPNAILPGPLFGSDTALINYSRTPYQGDAWGTTSTFSDKGYTPGPLTSANAYQLSSTELNPTGLTRPNQKPLEVLASVGFITTLGTGRLSGDFSLSNAYDIRNVGYEDPTDPTAPYPPPSSGAPRPLVKSGALGSLSNYGDLEANPEYLGCTERLPLGGLYRDKDFHGSRFSDEFSSPLVYVDTAGVGSGVAGLARTTELDQDEVLAMPASVSAGVPGDVLVMVDGEQSNYTQLLNYRTNRGGSVFVGSGDRPGGEVFATYSRLTGSGKGTRVLVGRAFLVRNAPTLVGATQVSGGDELMLALTTEVMELGTTPIEAMILIGTNGSGEGYAAADYYRIEGHPLIANHTWYDVDPSVIQLPLGKTIAQITAPSPTPVIPIGANNSVYSSDGVRNFWSNIPTFTDGVFTDLSVLNNLNLGTHGTSFSGGSVIFTQYALPSITQADAAPGVDGRTLQITAQKPVPNSVVTRTNGGDLSLASADVTSATPILANSGDIEIKSGALGSFLVGDTGNIGLVSGNQQGIGNSGTVSLATGSTNYGDSGTVSLATGPSIVSGNSGAASLATGPAVTGDSGAASLATGVVTTGNSGAASLATGVVTTGNSGAISLTTGAVTTGNSGDIELLSGVVSGLSGNGGSVTIRGGTVNNASNTSGSGGSLFLRGGTSLSSGFGGDVSLIGGASTSGSGGNVLLYSGGSATPGTIRGIIGGTLGVTYLSISNTDLVVGPVSVAQDYSIKFAIDTTNPTISQEDQAGAGKTLTVKASDVAVASVGIGGNLKLLSGVGRSAANGNVEIATPSGNKLVVSNDLVRLSTTILDFDKSVVDPQIQQETATSSDGALLSIHAQSCPSGFDGGSLYLYGGSCAGTGRGGDVDIISGFGTTPGRVLCNVGSANSTFEVHTTGVTLRNPTSGASGVHLTDSTAGPTIDAGADGLLYCVSGQLQFVDSNDINYNLTREITSGSDTSSIGLSSYTSSTWTTIQEITLSANCKSGDIVEGEIFFSAILSAASGGSPNYPGIRVNFSDGATTGLDSHAKTPYFYGSALWIDYVIPFSHVVSGSGLITEKLKLEARSDGTVSLSVICSTTTATNGIWVQYRIIRPAIL
jgi:hypothetical protein